MQFRIIPDFRILAFFFMVWAIFNVVDGVLANNTINTIKGVWAVLLSVYMLLAAKGLTIIIQKYWKKEE